MTERFQNPASLRCLVFAMMLMAGQGVAAQQSIMQSTAGAEPAAASPPGNPDVPDAAAPDPNAPPGPTVVAAPETPVAPAEAAGSEPAADAAVAMIEGSGSPDEGGAAAAAASTEDVATGEAAAVGTAADDPQAGAAASASPSAAKPSRPRARNVDLHDPIDPAQASAAAGVVASPAAPADGGGAAAPEGESFVLLNVEVPPATSARLGWSPTESFEGIALSTPVLVVNGAKPGMTLCLAAAVHGDELNGIEIVRRVVYNLDPKKLSGTVVGVPIVNLQGFRRGSRYLPDRRDLNRFFPGNPKGSSASRIAYSFFHEVIHYCDALVDLHTGSFHRTNLPQLRADLTHPGVKELSRLFGATVTLHSEDQPGTLRQAAVNAGIPAVTLEAGEPMRLQEKAVEHGVEGIRALLHNLDMYKSISFWKNIEPIYYKSVWVRANSGGILLNTVKLGERVDKGDTLGTVTDPITNVSSRIKAPYDGRVLGMALNQVVLPGFAAYRIGMQSSMEDASELSEDVQEDTASDPRDLDPETDTDDMDEDDLAALSETLDEESSE